MKTYQYVTIEIEQDTDARNPRDEFDNLSTFYGPRGTRYNVGGKQDIELESWNLSAHMQEFKREGAVIVPFTSSAGDCYAVITRQEVIKEYGNDSRSSLCHARQCAKGEIKTYLAWANGEVYGYTVTDKETGEHLDSCWGFCGLEYCEEEAQEQANYFEKQLADKQAQISTRLETVSR